jgi:hypothetical protein
MFSNNYFKEGMTLTLKFYSLLKWEKRKLQAWNEEWNFMQNQSKMQRGLCVTSRGGGGGRVKNCGVNM